MAEISVAEFASTGELAMFCRHGSFEGNGTNPERECTLPESHRTACRGCAGRRSSGPGRGASAGWCTGAGAGAGAVVVPVPLPVVVPVPDVVPLPVVVLVRCLFQCQSWCQSRSSCLYRFRWWSQCRTLCRFRLSYQL